MYKLYPSIIILLFVAQLSLFAQESLLVPDLWWATRCNTTGVASLSEHGEVLKEWPVGEEAIVNFHSFPILNHQEANFGAKTIDAKAGITTFSVYKDNRPDQEQPIWSLMHETELVAAATDVRFSNILDSVDYAFSGIDNQWLRLSTHFFNHQSLSHGNSMLYLGSHPHNHDIHFSGVLLEELVYGAVLSKKQRKKVESYLSVKYGIPLLSNSKVELINSAGHTYWSAPRHSLFRHRHTALGRDDFWGLYQKQSTNAYEPGLITIGLGEITPLNKENDGILEDQSFVVWSDNDGALVMNEASGLLERIWEIQQTNSKQPKTSLKLGARQLKAELAPGEQWWLAIDRSGEHSFSVQTTDYYAPMLNSEHGNVDFAQIQWDTDQSGRDHFTFLKGGDMLLVYDLQLPSCAQSQLGQIAFKVQGGRPPYRYHVQSLALSTDNWSGDLEVLTDLSVGRYVLWVTDANGLKVKEEIEIHHAELYDIAGLAPSYRVEEGTAIDIALAEACNDCFYEWRFPDGALSNNDQITTSIPGKYQLLISKEGCEEIFDFSVDQYESPFQSVELWGNPSQNGDYTLEIRLWKAQPTSIEIFNQQGQIVQSADLPIHHYHRFTGKRLAAGTYHIRVQSEGMAITKTLITL
jgi:hypothetical protein